MKKMIILSVLVFSLLIGCTQNLDKIGESCEEIGGNWLNEHNECEQITQEECENLKGTYNECASSCRHIEADMCIQVCVPVCYFN